MFGLTKVKAFFIYTLIYEKYGALIQFYNTEPCKKKICTIVPHTIIFLNSRIIVVQTY